MYELWMNSKVEIYADGRFRPLGVPKHPLFRLHSLDGKICYYFDVVDDDGGSYEIQR